MENIKVFELAKQMGMETIALMDKLREFKIPVKSHMAELDQPLIEQIRAKFDEEKSKTAPKQAKTTRTRKAASTASITPKVVKASQVKPVAAKKETGTATSAKTASARTVIRRKANAAETAAAASEQGAETSSAAPEQRDARIIEMPAREVSPQSVRAETAPEAAVQKTAEQQAAPAAQGAAPEKHAEPKIKTAQVISRIDLRETMGEKAAKTHTDRHAGVSSTAAGAPAPRPPGAAGEGEDAQKFDREAIGKLIKQEALAQARKAAALQRETKVETFNAAEFKKREMLFQPKKKKTLVGRAAQKTQITTPSAHKRKIKAEGSITVSHLAQAMGIKANEIIKKLMAMGSMVKINDVLDLETAQIIATDYNYEIENVAVSDQELIAKTSAELESGEMVPRPPVVTVMGHVDHGKTSLLDAIRKTDVAAGEAGGITQHIGAYSVDVGGRKITFLDTPGHEAFTAMRARGAKVTDIVILVVAADDGIMPQTREAITHAKSANVPIIVAVNKMDLPNANPQKVLQGLTEFELVPEEWGGTTIVAKVSAAKKEGIKELLEMILLQAEVLELKADAKRPASGTVIEAKLERGRGPVATLLVQQGTARVGEVLVAGSTMGRIRAMMNDKGQQIKEANPGMPVEVLGLDAAPNAGDTFDIVKDEDIAKEVVEKRIEKAKMASSTTLKMSLEDLFAKVQQQDIKELSVVIKADVQGSAEALKEMLGKLPSDQVKVKVLSAGVGGISESDVLLASASKAIIIGFNVRPESGVNTVAQNEGVEIKTYSIIYEVIDDIKKAMTGMLAPQFVEKALGRAEVRSLFNVPKVGTIAGCFVIDGRITRQAQVRLLRDSRVVYEGKLSSLKRFKDDVREVQNGYECGIGIENYNDLKVGDVLEAYMKEQVSALLH